MIRKVFYKLLVQFFYFQVLLLWTNEAKISTFLNSRNKLHRIVVPKFSKRAMFSNPGSTIIQA